MDGFNLEFWTVWSWLSIGLALVIVEMLAPGLIFVWFGVAAIIVGLVVAAFPSMAWETQLVLFAGLSVVSLGAGRMWLKKNPLQSTDNGLNRRAEQYVGRVFTLAEPVVDGEGKLKVDDSIWKVTGADMPQGACVRVTGAQGTVLTVEAE
jgi:membrane protein implicated in regulation of membrane protease activity